MTMPPPPETPQEPPTGWTPPGQPEYPQPQYPTAPPLPPHQQYPQQAYPQQQFPPQQGYPAPPFQPQPPIQQQPPFQPQPAPGASPTPPPAAPAAPRKRRTGLIVTIVGVVLVLCCGVTGGGGWWAYSKYQQGADDSEMSSIAVSVHGYEYDEHKAILSLGGSGSVTVDYYDGVTKHSVTTELPWQKTVTVAQDDFLVWMRSTADSAGSPQRCTIEVDGSRATVGGPDSGEQVACAVSFSS
ncbi:hypothetical protein AB0M47_41385 [Hamadaea sp. NPDC051192]|uniref:hypothetical protein n=1 Tax=Hamadaea sp. NPDC051192 TaxID=3154940 RepID=UPI003432ED14